MVLHRVTYGFLVGCLMLLNTSAIAQNDVYETIGHRIVEDLQSGTNDGVLADKVNESLELLNADGSWSDINYADAQYEPLKRIKEMATAYIRPKNRLYQSEKIYAAIVSSLQNWVDKNPKNKNWWYNDIFYPQAIGQTLLLMQNAKMKLPIPLQQTLVGRMVRRLKTGDGANTSDEALHFLYRACLTKNKATLDSAAKYLFEPISIEDGKEGVQVDGSYYQHGKQQAIASYGRVFVGNSVNAAYYLRNTEYALPKEKMGILVDYLKNTFLTTIRGSFYDFNVRGRGISRNDSLSANLSDVVEKIKMFDPENTPHWDVSALRTSNQKPASFGLNPSHKQFWKSGYTLNIRPKYSFSVQTASIRTLRTERGNNENILGKFLADGATNIQRSGSEYANLMPIWEWDKVPGITSRDYPTDSGATIQKEWGIPGSTRFAGGVSDGTYGVSAYDLDHDNVRGKKAWFFFDKEVVCLGAGIRSNSPEAITTTVNQTWLRTDLTLFENGKSSVLRDNQLLKSEKLSWVTQDSISYVFPNLGKVQVSSYAQNGSWYRINQFQSKTEVKGNVFKIWFDHGIKPSSASYQYIVMPGITDKVEVKNGAHNIHILKNTEAIQAVKHTGLNMLQIVFYKAGLLNKNGLYVEVDKACTIYIKDLDSQKPYFYIADPTQAIADIKVRIKLPAFNASKIINCTMPTGAFAGSTANFKISE